MVTSYSLDLLCGVLCLLPGLPLPDQLIHSTHSIKLGGAQLATDEFQLAGSVAGDAVTLLNGACGGGLNLGQARL